MKKIILFLILGIYTSIGFTQFDPSAWRQIENNPNLLKTISEQFEQDYKSTYIDSIHPEYKAYIRYLRYWHSRIGIKANGDYSYDPYL